MRAGARAVAATVRAAAAEVLANPAALVSQAAVMVLNDLAWIAFWLLFFDRAGSVRGWDAERVLLLLAVLLSAGGLVLGFLSNARRIGTLATEGELDAVLALPVPPLAYLLVRRIEPTNMGDLVLGIGLFAVAGGPTVGRAAVYLVGVAAATVVLTGFLVVTGSLAFFAGQGEAGELGFNAVVLLAHYPADILAGPSRVLLYTVVPAGFVAAVPAGLIDSFDPAGAAGLLAVAAAFGVGGWALFTLGLRRYTSGSVWTHA